MHPEPAFPSLSAQQVGASFALTVRNPDSAASFTRSCCCSTCLERRLEVPVAI